MLDTSQPVTGELPILGYFDVLVSGRTCEPGDTLQCLMIPAAAMTADGGTLFVGSEHGIHVLPVPASLGAWPPPTP